ncbi:thiol-disulfide isomerase [Azoarcus sp. DN11]|nr:thiol-disulfide isomerase [Azoarcus sp. DN11]
MKKAFVSLALCLAAFAAPALATPGEVPEGGTLREAPMQGLTAGSRLLGDFRGKPLIINVWASYCPPCLAEMGSLERLSKRYGKQFNVIGVSIDDYPERAQAFLTQAKTSFPHFIDRQLALENMLGANRIPLTLLVDADGKVLHKVVGAKEWDSPETVETIRKAFGLRM